MDLLTHLLAFDEQFIRQALSELRKFPDQVLDEPIGESQPFGFDASERTLRQLLDKLVLNKEVWVAAISGGVMPPEDRNHTLEGLEQRLNISYPQFSQIAKGIQAESRWQQTFQDHLCEPPEIFPFGGMLAHVVTVDSYRRFVLSAWLQRLDIRIEADPMYFGSLSNEVII